LLRLIMIVLTIGLYIAAFYYQPFYVHYTHTTYWALHLTLISLLLSFTAGGDKHNLSAREWALVTTELALTFTTLAIIFYFSVVRDELKRDITRTDNYFHTYLRFLHIMPFVLVLTNFALSDIEFLKKDVAFVALIAIAYVVLNLLVSKLSGVPVYPFVTWHDLRSFVSALIFVLVLCGIYMVCVMLSAILPRKESEYYGGTAPTITD
jgi:hypothetical protein